MLKKIEKMYHLYGKYRGCRKCKECSNYTRYTYHDKPYRKCSVYGITCSEATDWTGSWDACGRFGRALEAGEREVVRVSVKETREPVEVLDGQISIFDLGG